MRICTVVGARPQFIKAAAISARIAETENLEEIIIHTGQHYDAGMSDIFFTELNIPKEKYNLEIGSGSQGAQTGRMMEKLEEVLHEEKPDCVLTYGDTNSTIAAAITAVKSHIPIVHIEAGMRSFNRKMPEEINRVITDHVAELNFCSNETAVQNLKNEGRGHTAILVGDVMIDCCRVFGELADKNSDVLSNLKLNPDEYLVVTCHRAENTNDPERLRSIIQSINDLSSSFPVLCSVHPRLKSYMEKYSLTFADAVLTTEPLGYLDMLALQKNARVLLTDSGGMQKEAFFFGTPCVTMRDETEWTDTVELGWNAIVGADARKIEESVKQFSTTKPAVPDCSPYGDGYAAEKIISHLKSWLESGAGRRG